MYSKLSRRRCAQEFLASFRLLREIYEDEYSDDERFLFKPSFGPKYPRTKHQEFVEYFKEGVKIADITANLEVLFLKRVNIINIPGQCIL